MYHYSMMGLLYICGKDIVHANKCNKNYISKIKKSLKLALREYWYPNLFYIWKNRSYNMCWALTLMD